jgi:hypothetical protein
MNTPQPVTIITEDGIDVVETTFEVRYLEGNKTAFKIISAVNLRSNKTCEPISSQRLMQALDTYRAWKAVQFPKD